MAHPEVKEWLSETAVSGEGTIHEMRASHGVRVFWALASVGFGYSLLMAVYKLSYTLPVMLGVAALLLLRYAWRWHTRTPRSQHRFDLALQCFSRMAPLTQPDRDVQLMSSQSDRWSVRIQTPGEGYLIIDVTDRDERIRTEITLWVPFALSSLDVERLDMPRVLGVRPTGRLLVEDTRSSLELVCDVACDLDARRRVASGEAAEEDVALEVAELVAYVVRLLEQVHEMEASDVAPETAALLILEPAAEPPPEEEPGPFEHVFIRSAAEEASERQRRFVRNSLWMRLAITALALLGLHIVFFEFITSIGKGDHSSPIFVVCGTIFTVIATYLVLPMPPRVRALSVRQGHSEAFIFDGVRLVMTTSEGPGLDLSEPITCTLTRAMSPRGDHIDVGVSLLQTSSGSGALDREELRWQMRVRATEAVMALPTFNTASSRELPGALLVEQLWPLLRRHVGVDWTLRGEPVS